MHYTITTLLALAAASTTALAQQSPGCGNTSPPTGGVRTMEVNGKQREYTLYVPDTYSPDTAYKLIFGYHWLNGNMGNVVEGGYYGLEGLAAGSAIFVAPNGLNAGWANEGGEDLTFTDQIIEEVEAELCVDQSQRYATGFSYGGAMTYAVACSRAGTSTPHAFTAVAVIAGAELSGCEGGTDPLPYLGIHGVADSVLAIDMGRAIRDTFVATNGCSGDESAAPGPGSSADFVKSEFTCSEDPVVWIAHGGDHIPNPEFAPEETWGFWEPYFSNGAAAPADGGAVGNATAPSSAVAAPAPASSSAAAILVAPSSAAAVPAPSSAAPFPVASSSVAAVPADSSAPAPAAPVESADAGCEIVYV